MIDYFEDLVVEDISDYYDQLTDEELAKMFEIEGAEGREEFITIQNPGTNN